MAQHAYFASVLWELIEVASGVAYWVAPILFLVVCAGFTVRRRSIWSSVALLGAILSIGERVARAFSQGIHFIYLGGRQPTDDQNPLLMFVFLHGGNLGFLLISIGLVGLLLRKSAA